MFTFYQQNNNPPAPPRQTMRRLTVVINVAPGASVRVAAPPVAPATLDVSDVLVEVKASAPRKFCGLC